MQIIGLALISPWTTAKWKALWNDSALVIFPVSTQHREAGIDGVRYDDDGKGNALAVIFDQLTFEVRGHPHFSPQRVLNLWNKLKSRPGLEYLAKCRLLYQGQVLERLPEK